MDHSEEQPRWLTALAQGDDSEAARLALYEFTSRVVDKARRKKGVLVPRFVGLDGDRWTPESKAELANEFFCHVLERLPELTVRAREGTLPVGFLVRMAKNFLEDRRRAADPVGTSGYRKLRESVRRQLAEGSLRIAGPSGDLDKNARLEIVAKSGWPVVDIDDLRAAVRSYPEHEVLLRQFCGKGHKETEALRGLWPHLARENICSFVLADLLKALVPESPSFGEDVESLARTDLAIEDPLARAVHHVSSSALPEARRTLLVTLLDRLQEPRERGDQGSGGWEFNQAEVGRSMGLSRQRTQELVAQLRHVLGPLARELDIDPDAECNRPSSSS